MDKLKQSDANRVRNIVKNLEKSICKCKTEEAAYAIQDALRILCAVVNELEEASEDE